MSARVTMLRVGVLYLLAMSSVSAEQQCCPRESYSSPGFPGTYPSPDGYKGEVVPPRNVTCKDKDGKRPGCTGTCPNRCPQQCIVLCPDCKIFCHDAVQPPKPVPPPAMFVFGDGTLDIGNNGYLPKTQTEGSSPQVSKSSSGRFSNGASLADAIATFMGYEMSPPAYMSLHGEVNMLGANYASAGAGIRNSTNGERCIPLWKQLGYFRATRAQMEAKLGGEAKLREFLAKSIFLLSVGGQDLDPRYNAYLDHPTPQTELQDLVALYGEAVKSLYDMGARKLAIVNVGLIGCMPRDPLNFYFCDESLNDRAAAFDAALKPLMAGLASKKPGLFYSIGDLYAYTTAVFANPGAHGLVNTEEACSYWSNPEPCNNPDKYWFWEPDSITDQAAMLTGAAFYYVPQQFTVPITFKALLEKK